MRGETATRVALGAAVALGIVLVAMIVLGGRQAAAPPAASEGPPSRLSAHDTLVLGQVGRWIRSWNVASDGWSAALQAGRERFLTRHETYTRRMNLSSLRIRLSAPRIQNRRLRTLMRRLGDLYRRQFRAVRDVNRAVVAEDPVAADEASTRLEAADDERIDVATQLVDEFPELASDPGRLR